MCSLTHAHKAIEIEPTHNIQEDPVLTGLNIYCRDYRGAEVTIACAAECKNTQHNNTVGASVFTLVKTLPKGLGYPTQQTTAATGAAESYLKRR